MGDIASNTAAAIAAGCASAEPRVPAHNGDDVPFVVVPAGYQVHALEQLLGIPTRKRGIFQFHDVESFIGYCKRHATGGEVYADRSSTKFSIALNGHTADEAGWGDHRAVYACPLTREWKTWHGQNGRAMNQEQFAQFIEDNLNDIVPPKDGGKPTAADMLLVSRSFEAKSSVKFQSGVRLESGDVDLTYSETTTASAGAGKIRVPDAFCIGIKVFENGDTFRIRALLRYRITEGRLSIWYQLERPEAIIETAFNDVVKKVRAGLDGFELFFGAHS